MTRTTTSAPAHPHPARSRTGPDPDDDGADRNEVVLVGRVSGPPAARVLPSGDEVLTLRVVVSRPAGSRRTPRSPTVDTVDVACWSGRARAAARRLDEGDRVRVRGALRRRFQRASGGVASRYEVEAVELTRVARARGR